MVIAAGGTPATTGPAFIDGPEDCGRAANEANAYPGSAVWRLFYPADATHGIWKRVAP